LDKSWVMHVFKPV